MKWADKDNKTYDMSENPISSIIVINCAEIDFNGWTIDNLKIHDTVHSGFYEYGRFFQINKSVSIKNLIMNIVETVHTTELFYCNIGSNIATNVYINISATTRTSVSISNGFGGYGNAFFISKSILKVSGILLDAFYFGDVTYKNCEIETNITFYHVNSLPFSNFLKATEYSGMLYLKNCYLHGNLENVSKINVACVYNTIFNYDFSLLTIYIDDFNLPSRWVQGWDWDNDIPSNVNEPPALIKKNENATFVPNVTDSWALDYFISEDDLRSYDTIKSKKYTGVNCQTEFIIKNNTNERFQQFNNIETEDWTFQIDININDGVPFLPFWKYPLIQSEGIGVYIGVNKVPITNIYRGRKPIIKIYRGNKRIM